MSQPQHADDELRHYRRLAAKSQLLGMAWKSAPPPAKTLMWAMTIVIVSALAWGAHAAGMPLLPDWTDILERLIVHHP